MRNWGVLGYGEISEEFYVRGTNSAKDVGSIARVETARSSSGETRGETLWEAQEIESERK
jgi:hypothetical protein